MLQKQLSLAAAVVLVTNTGNNINSRKYKSGFATMSGKMFRNMIAFDTVQL